MSSGLQSFTSLEERISHKISYLRTIESNSKLLGSPSILYFHQNSLIPLTQIPSLDPLTLLDLALNWPNSS